jgi:hypothetical protein
MTYIVNYHTGSRHWSIRACLNHQTFLGSGLELRKASTLATGKLHPIAFRRRIIIINPRTGNSLAGPVSSSRADQHHNPQRPFSIPIESIQPSHKPKTHLLGILDSSNSLEVRHFFLDLTQHPLGYFTLLTPSQSIHSLSNSFCDHPVL